MAARKRDSFPFYRRNERYPTIAAEKPVNVKSAFQNYNNIVIYYAFTGFVLTNECPSRILLSPDSA